MKTVKLKFEKTAIVTYETEVEIPSHLTDEDDIQDFLTNEMYENPNFVEVGDDVVARHYYVDGELLFDACS